MAVIYGVVLTLVTVLSIVLNSLALFIFFIIRNKLDFKDILLISLALSDLLQAVLGYPVEITATLQGKWMYGSDTCVFSGFSLTFLGLVSISHLVCLAAERYVSIVKPFFGEIIYRRRRYAVCVSVASWIYAFFWAILPIMGISSYTFESETVCSINWKGKSRANKVYISLLFVFCYLLPVTIMATMFSLVVIELRQMLQNSQRMTGQDSQMVRDTYKVAKINSLLVLTMITAFLVAWTPYAAVSLRSVVSPHSYMRREFEMTIAIFAKSSTVFNAVIYTLVYKKFRQALWKVLRKTFGGNRVSPVGALSDSLTLQSS